MKKTSLRNASTLSLAAALVLATTAWAAERTTTKRTTVSYQQQIDRLNSRLNNLQQQLVQLQGQQQQASGAAHADLNGRLAKLESVLKVDSANRVVLESSSIHIRSQARLRLSSSEIALDAGKVDLNAAVVTASSMLKSKQLVTETVVSQTYTPGSGNVW